jgi:hypothetical protein
MIASRIHASAPRIVARATKYQLPAELVRALRFQDIIFDAPIEWVMNCCGSESAAPCRIRLRSHANVRGREKAALRRVSEVVSHRRRDVHALGGQIEDLGLAFGEETSIHIGRKLGLC